MNKIITPKILQGTRDFLPAEMAKRDYVTQKIKDVFVRFGYDTIDTPAIEYAETLLGKYGEEGSKLLYRFRDNGDRDVALRYDQTVPFARVVAANTQNLPMPFKRYQISKVWRADRPAKGRYREFTQCDIDIIGTRSLVAEAEIAKMMDQVFRSLGFQNFIIKFNSRRLMNSILEGLSIPKNCQTDVIRIIDKLEKIGDSAVSNELEKIIDKKSAAGLLKILTIQGLTPAKISSLKEYSTGEIEEFLKIAEGFDIPEKNLVFDPCLARGLDYYTGVTYEVVSPDAPLGALCGGGRYDDLCSLFCNKEISGVGVAFGFDRIVLAMETLGLLKEVSLNAEALVTYFDSSTLKTALGFMNELQQAGVNTEIYFDPDKMARQFSYADKKKIPFVILCGPDEIEKKEVTIKSMKTGKQKTIPQNQMISYLTGYRS